MNKKGFTLTELLASITILALISTIAGFTYTKIIKDNKIKQCEQKILYIEKQTIKYLSDNPEFLHDSNEINIKIDDAINNFLEKEGYLIKTEEDDETKNPLTENTFKDGTLNITKTNGLIDVKYIGDECNE